MRSELSTVSRQRGLQHLVDKKYRHELQACNDYVEEFDNPITKNTATNNALQTLIGNNKMGESTANLSKLAMNLLKQVKQKDSMRIVNLGV